MTPNNPIPEKAATRGPLRARRLALLATVAGLGAVALLTGPGGFGGQTFSNIAGPAQAAEATQHPAGFADLVAKVKPAVISVKVKIDRTAEAETNGSGNAMPLKPGGPLDKFFDQFGFSDVPKGLRRPRQQVMGEGSGFFISADGYAVTNNHVVDHANSVEVKTDDGKTHTAKVIGTDSKTDLALIKVEGDNNFPYVTFSKQQPRVGDWVLAVGNPFGLGGTVTAGIVSARGRDIGAGPYDDYIQIDAPINKGNSGGPAFDVDGNVIGVNTAIFSPSGGSVGIGFDVPAETAQLVVSQLKDKGHVTRGWLGVQIQPVTAEIADSLGLKQAQGAIVAAPQPGSPAAKAGIAAGDVITAVNGTPVKDARDLARRVAGMAPGASVKFDVLRNGENKTLNVTLAEMPNDQQAKADTDRTSPRGGNQSENGGSQSESNVPHLGLQLAPASDVDGAGDNGVVVVDVEDGSTAAEHGVKTGDVILAVGGKSVSKPTDVRDALVAARNQGRHDVLVRIKTADATHFVALPLG